jgi:hypothetical protein
MTAAAETGHSRSCKVADRCTFNCSHSTARGETAAE